MIGVPFYGYGWVPEKMDNHGLYQAVKAKAVGKPDAGIATWPELKAKPGEVFSDNVTKSIVKVSNGEVWTYDDPSVLKEKVAYIKAKKTRWCDGVGTVARHPRRRIVERALQQSVEEITRHT